MTKRFAPHMRFWAKEFEQRLIQNIARNMRQARAARVVRAFEQVGQPFELDLLGIDPEIADANLKLDVLGDGRVLELSSGRDGLPSEVVSWNPLRAFRISEGLLDVDSGLAFVGSKVVSQSGTGHRWVRDAAFITGALRRVADERTAQLGGDIAWFGVNPNYYHLLIESLPRLLRLRDLAPGIQFVSNAPVPELVREIDPDLADRVILIKQGTVVKAEHLWMITPHPLFAPYPGDLDFLFERFSQVVQPREAALDVFVSRGRNQRIAGVEGVLGSRLREQGFRVEDFAALAWKAQVEMVASTKTLVGVHGAGLSNLVFMPPGGRVIEISDGSWWFPCYRRMAHARGHSYSLIVVNGQGTLDIEAVVRVVLERVSDG